MNDTTVTINLDLNFANDYNYPEEYDHAEFKVILFSTEWSQDGVAISEDWIKDIPTYMDQAYAQISLMPKSVHKFTIGILRPVRSDLCSAIPYAIMEHNEFIQHPDCTRASTREDQVSQSSLALGLKVGFCTIGGNYEGCILLPCGQISYSSG